MDLWRASSRSHLLLATEGAHRQPFPSQEKTMQTSILILLSALALGATGTQLIKPTFTEGLPPGAGLSSWFILNFLTYAAFVLRYRKRESAALWYLLPASISALAFSFRASGILQILDLATVFTNCALSVATTIKSHELTTGSIKDYSRAFFSNLLVPYFGTIDLIVHDITWSTACPEKLKPHLEGLIKGVVIATPLLFIFTLLFVAADPAFAAIGRNLFHLDAADISRDLVITAILAAISAGTMRQLIILKNARFQGEECGADGTKSMAETSSLCTFRQGKANTAALPSIKLGMVELGTALTLINTLFAAFVAVQIHYLFGGAKLVQLTPALSYAEYARHGFFELCTVAALVIPMLLSADAVRNKTSRKEEIAFRALSLILLSLVSVIIASAVQRMHLYTLEYGLSELRIYTLAFMAWLAVVCSIFSLTVLTGNRPRFAFASYIAGLLAIYALHIVNPDALIETTNIALAKQGKTLDTMYLTHLSGDSVTPLMEHFQELSPAQKKEVAGEILSWEVTRKDPRTYNFSRRQAGEAIRSHKKELETALSE